MKPKHLRAVLGAYAPDSYWTDNILRGMRAEAAARGISLTLYTHVPPHILQGEVIPLVEGSAPWCTDRTKEITAAGGMPLLVCAGAQQSSAYCRVSLDIAGAVEQSVRYLLACARRRILFFGLNDSNDTDRYKYEVFRRCDFGGATTRAYFCDAPIDESAQSFVRTFTKECADAILCTNDTLALTLLCAGLGTRVRLPEDVFLVGMGNSALGAACALPLTSVSFDYVALGKVAVRTALCMTDSDEVPMQTLIGCPLCVRASTADCPFPHPLPQRAGAAQSPGWFTGENSRTLVHAETFIQTADKTDRRILFLLAQGKTYAQIADALSLTERAVHYRADAIKKKLNFTKSQQIREYFQNILGLKEKELW